MGVVPLEHFQNQRNPPGPDDSSYEWPRTLPQLAIKASHAKNMLLKWLWVKNRYRKWLALASGNMNQNLRSNSWWFTLTHSQIRGLAQSVLSNRVAAAAVFRRRLQESSPQTGGEKLSVCFVCSLIGSIGCTSSSKKVIPAFQPTKQNKSLFELPLPTSGGSKENWLGKSSSSGP